MKAEDVSTVAALWARREALRRLLELPDVVAHEPVMLRVQAAGHVFGAGCDMELWPLRGLLMERLMGIEGELRGLGVEV